MMQRALVGLIGANIMRSLSPALHDDAFAAAGVAGHYHLMDVDVLKGRSLKSLLDAVKTAGFCGTNVTFPFKQEVLTLLDAVDPEAAQIGAVNTVTIGPDGRTTGYNTDRRGFRRSFEEQLGRPAADGAKAVLVGAGGAGRAVAFALMDLGIAELAVFDRDARQAADLLRDLAKYYEPSRSRPVSDLEADIAKANGVANATPVGMEGKPGNPVPANALHAEQWAADVIYTPIETAFIKATAAKGLRVATGGGMCVHQAVEAFQLFTGIKADVGRMHRTFAKALAARDAAMAQDARAGSGRTTA
ncbi:MAG: shikimate dehydrogenase [Pseudolabrys sp.]|nr:shikimate dehydrogenase [Pseudolabrys sp.]